MSAQEAVPHAGASDAYETANDRYKKSYANWFWGSIIVATVLHFGVFYFWPDMEAEDVSYAAEELENIELPPEVEIPPPPDAIARPATPVVTSAEVSEDITIAPTTFEDNPVEDLPPPPEETNRSEVARALEREYPPLLRDAGIGGRVVVWFFINEEGVVENTEINESSGQDALDQAALRVAEVMEFTPALNRDEQVPVWISLPITFQTSN